MTRNWTEEKIAALVDDSLEDPQEIEALRWVLEQDSEARAHADGIRVSNDLLRQAFAIPAEEPTPAAIQAAIFGEPDKVAVLKPRPRVSDWVPTSIAASLALVVGLGIGGWYGGGTMERGIAALGDAPPGGPLHLALETLPSGSLSEAGVQPMLSFRDGAGRACREFEVLDELPGELEFGIACRNASEGWRVEIVVSAPLTEPRPDGYRPASGAASSALDAMLDALGAGAAMDPAEEAALLKNGW